MMITAVCLFRDGTTTYQPGTDHEVPYTTGARFVEAGWATSPTYTRTGQPATAHDLDVHSVRHHATTTEV